MPLETQVILADLAAPFAKFARAQSARRTPVCSTPRALGSTTWAVCPQSEVGLKSKHSEAKLGDRPVA